jgi:hypothetical protein
MTHPEDKKPLEAPVVAAAALPDSIRPNHALVDLAEWVASHTPWSYRTAARARQRIGGRAA